MVMQKMQKGEENEVPDQTNGRMKIFLDSRLKVDLCISEGSCYVFVTYKSFYKSYVNFVNQSLAKTNWVNIAL